MNADQRRVSLGLAVVTAVAGAAGLLVGCQTSSEQYVGQRAEDFVISKGEVLKTENVISADVQKLRDGVAFPVSQDGMKVTMRFGPRTETLNLMRGDILVQSDAGDFVLQQK